MVGVNDRGRDCWDGKCGKGSVAKLTSKLAAVLRW